MFLFALAEHCHEVLDELTWSRAERILERVLPRERVY
jgi:hypothetical protein